MSGYDEGYRFDIANGSVAAVYEVEHGRMEQERMDSNETWTVSGSDVIKTERDHGRIETTTYSDPDGDGLYHQAQKSYQPIDGTRPEWDRDTDADRDDSSHNDEGCADDSSFASPETSDSSRSDDSGQASPEVAADFDAAAYLAANPDIFAAYGWQMEAAEAHWEVFGKHEGRHHDFDAAAYLAVNPDLQAAFGQDIEAAAHHYAVFGREEGRDLGLMIDSGDLSGGL